MTKGLRLIRFLLVLLTVCAFAACTTSGEDASKPKVSKPTGTNSFTAAEIEKGDAKPEVPESTETRRGPTKYVQQKSESERAGGGQGLNAPDSGRAVAALLPSKSAREVVIEKLSGYKTPAEYFTIPSRKYPQGVVAVSLPIGYEKNTKRKYPLVIAFGGAGECARSPRDGALAWLYYYKTDEAVRALANNRLTPDDFRRLITPPHLNDFNRKLKARPYSGIILACPSSPLLTPQVGLEFPEYEEYIMDELVPALKSRYRVADAGVGVDGVSMGGARSMYYGFKYPEVFSSIGSVQGAFGPYFDIYRHFVERHRETLKKRSIQLVTSDRDPMAPSVERMHQLLVDNSIPHLYLKLTGPHDYIFNQGPGALELLVFHDHALR
ncbi:MAG: alpha/beta hydrolase [Desulfomonilaceae bacterium]